MPAWGKWGHTFKRRCHPVHRVGEGPWAQEQEQLHAAQRGCARAICHCLPHPQATGPCQATTGILAPRLHGPCPLWKTRPTCVMSGPNVRPTPRASFDLSPGSATGSDHSTSAATTLAPRPARACVLSSVHVACPVTHPRHTMGERSQGWLRTGCGRAGRVVPLRGLALVAARLWPNRTPPLEHPLPHPPSGSIPPLPAARSTARLPRVGGPGGCSAAAPRRRLRAPPALRALGSGSATSLNRPEVGMHGVLGTRRVGAWTGGSAWTGVGHGALQCTVAGRGTLPSPPGLPPANSPASSSPNLNPCGTPAQPSPACPWPPTPTGPLPTSMQHQGLPTHQRRQGQV